MPNRRRDLVEGSRGAMALVWWAFGLHCTLWGEGHSLGRGTPAFPAAHLAFHGWEGNVPLLESVVVTQGPWT